MKADLNWTLVSLTFKLIFTHDRTAEKNSTERLRSVGIWIDQIVLSLELQSY